MNSANRSERRRAFQETLQLMSLRHQGVPAAEAPRQNSHENLQELYEKTQEVVEELLARLQISDVQIAALSEKLVSVLDTESLQNNNTAMHRQVQSLQSIQKGLKSSLEEIQGELEAEKKHKADLVHMLAELRQKLKEHSGSRLENFMYQGGERISYRIATGNPYPSDNGRPQSQRTPAEHN